MSCNPSIKRLRCLAVALLACAAGTAFGQGFPLRPITLYIPFVPGPTELMARKFAEVAAEMKASILHVPYKGGSDVMRALLGGEIMIAGDTGAAFASYSTSGRARSLVQFGETRVRWMPEVPTARELGLDMVYTVPTVVAAPRGLPEAIVQRLHEAFSKTFEDKNALRFFENMKKEPWPMTPAAATAWAKESVVLERRMVERAGMALK